MATPTYSSRTHLNKALTEIQKTHKAKSLFQVTDIDKITINTGVGKFENKNKEEIAGYLEKLTGQKPKIVKARMSVAGFKLRQGQTVGYLVTLRGQKMEDFLLSLIYLALPRSRDFRGTKANAFDATQRTYSLGVPNAGIFPTIGFDTGYTFGIQVNITFKNSSPQNRELLEAINFPLKKQA